MHWSYADVMNMEHAERQQWVEEVACINNRINAMTVGTAADEVE